MAKKAGRPKGSGIPEGAVLDRVADMLVARQAKTPNAAIMSIYRKDKMTEPSENYRRRVSRKWKRQGEDRLAAARQRHNEANRVPERVVDRRHVGDILANVRQVGDVFANMRQAGVFDDLVRAQEQVNQAMQLQDSLRQALGPAFEVQQQFERSLGPAIQLAQEMDRINRLCDPLYGIR